MNDPAWKMFEGCKADDHDDCAAELFDEEKNRWAKCACECHGQGEDRAYAAGYNYACGYHD